MPSIAVVHYCEGAGHATRMLAIARALEAGGATVHLAGGGAGARFVDLHGYDAFEPTTVDYIDDYQGGSMADVLGGSVPDSARRTAEIADWLREVDADALVTDDMFAVMAAVRVGLPQYVLKHDTPAVYDDRIERAGAGFHCSLQRVASRTFFYPTVWEPESDLPEGVERVPPVALDATDDDPDVPDDLDAVVVPSHYSELDAVAERLADHGCRVAHVGGDDWEAVPALLPYVRAADAVICSGYSTVMEAAVAGTPCVVLPATDEQEGVARQLYDRRGVHVVKDVDAAVAAARAPEPLAPSPNGAAVIADRVLDDFDTGPAPTPSDSPSTTTLGRRRLLRAAAATAGTLVAGSAAVSAADSRGSYWLRGARSPDRSVDRPDLGDTVDTARETFDAPWPAALREVDADRFDGATLLAESLADEFDPVTGDAPVRALQATLRLGEDATADYRHWLWLGVDLRAATVRTGPLRQHTAPLGARHARVSFAPGDGEVAAVGLFPRPDSTGDGEAVTLADRSRAAFSPEERPPPHPAGDPPGGAASLVWRDSARQVSLLGWCETRLPDTDDADWTDGTWRFAVDPVPASD